MAHRYPGNMVRVTTRRLGGGEPMRVVYAVAEPNPQKAEEIVRNRTSATSDETVEALGPITRAALKGYGLTAGQFKRA